ncbi:MAG: MFS transporter [Proteobacteria bacterium]|nr:MFS transporter [Pseudomonadota bacterium]
MPRSRQPLLTSAFVRILAMQALFGASQACYVLLPKFLATELEAAAPDIGAIAAMYSVAVVVLVPTVGAGIDRFGRRLFLLIGNAVSTGSALAFAWVDELGPAVYLLRGLQGVGFACVFIAASTLVADYVPQRLGQALAVLSSTMHGTSATVPLVVESVADSSGWSPVFVASAVCAAGAWVVSFWIRNRTTCAASRPVPAAGMASFLRRGVAWRTLFVVSMVGVAVSGLMVFIQPFVLERGIERVAPFLVSYSAVAMAVRVFFGGWLDRFDRYLSTTGAVGGYTLLLTLVPWATSAWLIPLGALFGVVHGAFFPAFNAMGLQGTDPDERGKSVAIVNGSFNVGFAAGNFGLGYAAAAWGYSSVFGIAATGMGAAFGMLLAVRGAERWSLAQRPGGPAETRRNPS